MSTYLCEHGVKVGATSASYGGQGGLGFTHMVRIFKCAECERPARIAELKVKREAAARALAEIQEQLERE